MSEYDFLQALNTSKAEALSKRSELNDALEKIDQHLSEIDAAIRLYQKMKPFVAPPPSTFIQNSPVVKGISAAKKADLLFDIYAEHSTGIKTQHLLRILREKHGLEMSNGAALLHQKELEAQGFIKKVGWGIYAPVED
jgi:F0F1-type ATP synthase delta subunit